MNRVIVLDSSPLGLNFQKPAAHLDALDVDVILAAQVLTAGFQSGSYVVATTNVSHLSQFVTRELWDAV